METANNIIISSFYTNLLVCFLITIASLMVFLYIINFCFKNKIYPKKIISLAIFWFFAGIAWFFSGLSIINTRLEATNPPNIYEFLSFFSVNAFCLSITFHVFYKNTFNSKKAWLATGFIGLLGVLYNYFLVFHEWGDPISSDWGYAFVPPKSVVIMSLIMGVIYVCLVFYDFGMRVYKLIIYKTRARLNEFVADLAIVAYFSGAMVDVIGTPGWRMVSGRIFILSSVLVAFIAVFLTSYLEDSAEEEQKLKK